MHVTRRDGPFWVLIVAGLVLAASLALLLWWAGGRTTSGATDPVAAATSPGNRASVPPEEPRVRRALPTAPPVRPSGGSDTAEAMPSLTPTASPTASASQEVESGAATVLSLPSLGVRAPVSPVTVAAGSPLIPPSDPTTVGWWSGGAEPGAAEGTALIAGHTVHTGGGALDNLEQMEPGDQVIIERAGPDLAYRVASVTVFSKASLASRAQELFRQDGPGQLAVVTCEDWTGEVYLSNVVVIATNPQALPE